MRVSLLNFYAKGIKTIGAKLKKLLSKSITIYKLNRSNPTLTFLHFWHVSSTTLIFLCINFLHSIRAYWPMEPKKIWESLSLRTWHCFSHWSPFQKAFKVIAEADRLSRLLANFSFRDSHWFLLFQQVNMRSRRNIS